jgi:hypothetical protein
MVAPLSHTLPVALRAWSTPQTPKVAMAVFFACVNFFYTWPHGDSTGVAATQWERWRLAHRVFLQPVLPQRLVSSSDALLASPDRTARRAEHSSVSFFYTRR